jgi:adenylate kinase
MKNRLELGKKIHESFSSHSYVEDEIVIELLKNIITEHEKNGINYIIEGFPKTQRQALALLKMGIIPDKFILLDRRDGEVIEYLQDKIKNEEVCRSSLRGAGK